MGDPTIDIIKNIDKLPNIQVMAADKSSLSQRIIEMLLTDLKVSGHFNNISFENAGSNTLNSTYLNNLKLKDIGLLADVSVSRSFGTIKATLTLYDTSSDLETPLLEKSYEEPTVDLFPFISHNMANDINVQIGADSIKWMTGYVVFSRYTGSGKSEISISDYTLTYQKVLIKDGLNIFPKWANSSKDSFYYTKIGNKADIRLYNIYTGKDEDVLSSNGMAIVSDVSSDGKKLLLSLAPNGLSDIYLYNLDDKKLTRLTSYTGIDVNGSFINNDKSFAFVSDRLGYPNIFIKGLSPNAPVTQLVYHGKNNSSLSTYKNNIVYSSRESDEDTGLNVFNLYLASTQSDYIRRLSKSGTNQMPKFSKDGDAVMYLKQTPQESGLGIIRLSINKSFIFPLKFTKIQSFDW
ncbi:tol-Pal system beta propeller repeat protein TolB [Helicobacter sp. 13S00401-1]|nr:tol-Pal system beta propeller repeat protein TolB [Helicobacter sp. 13S00401-1]